MNMLRRQRPALATLVNSKACTIRTRTSADHFPAIAPKTLSRQMSAHSGESTTEETTEKRSL
jgi:hypothetical protein